MSDEPRPAHPTTTADEPQPAHPTTTADEPQPAHPTSVVVWGAPSPIVAASRFAVTVGAKCAVACPLAGRPVVVRDETGRDVGQGSLGTEPAAGTRALYAAAVLLTAPPEPGVHNWTATVPASTGPAQAATARSADPAAAEPTRHEAAACTFSFRTVEPPGNAVTVTVLDRDTESPLGNADVHLGVYRASTDAEGKARVEAPAGEYELYVRSPGYTPYTQPLTVTGDAVLRVAAARVSDADFDDDQVWM